MTAPLAVTMVSMRKGWLPVLVVALAASTVAHASGLHPVRNRAGLAAALAWGTQLAETGPGAGQPYFVRVWAVPSQMNECDGPVASCPDIRLYVAVSGGDLGDSPALYELPPAKDWTFLGWDNSASTEAPSFSRFSIGTALPEANVSAEARMAWRSTVYRVSISPSTGTFTTERARPEAEP